MAEHNCTTGTLPYTRDELERYVQERTAALVRANETLQQFAYVASHDLQEPLRTVSTYAHLLAKRYRGKLDAEAEAFLCAIVDGVTHMQQLIQGLLAYSQVETQGQTFTVTDCTAVLERTLSTLQMVIAETKATVTYDPLPTVLADASQLGQVFQNLISNALKFRAHAPPHVHISARRDGTHWVFAVQDNGIGLNPQFAERIFVMFQRLHTRKEYPGTGIGLAICKSIIERHGGRIWVESEPGKGAIFYFTLPATLST